MAKYRIGCVRQYLLATNSGFVMLGKPRLTGHFETRKALGSWASSWQQGQPVSPFFPATTRPVWKTSAAVGILPRDLGPSMAETMGGHWGGAIRGP